MVLPETAHGEERREGNRQLGFVIVILVHVRELLMEELGLGLIRMNLKSKRRNSIKGCCGISSINRISLSGTVPVSYRTITSLNNKQSTIAQFMATIT